jgi:hypothetical protein
MAAIDDAQLLAAWETALTRERPLRGPALLAQADPDSDERTLAALPLGEAARRQLDLHSRWFGRRLACACHCPACGEAVEADCDAAALGGAAAPLTPTPPSLSLEQQGYRVLFRLPSSLDLVEAARAVDASQAQRVLLRRCVLEAWHEGDACAGADLPEAVIQAVAAAMEAADPLADIQLALRCPSCGAHWSAALEPEHFLLSAVEHAARALMREVDVLGRAYGWTEAETLALGRFRRRAYLELAES